MSTPVGKRPLSQSTPSPSSVQAKKVIKMAESNPINEGMAGLQALNQAYTSQDNGSQVNPDIFLQLFNKTETEALDIVAGEEKWEFVVKALKSIGEEIGQLRRENSDLKNSLHSSKGLIIKLEHQIDHQQKKLMDLEWNSLQKILSCTILKKL